MNRRELVVLLAVCGACSGGGMPDPSLAQADACLAQTANLSLSGNRFPEGVELSWTGSDAGSYEIWAFGEGHADVFQNPVITVTEAAVNLATPADLGVVDLEARPVVNGKACPSPASALEVLEAPTLSGHARDGGIEIDWQADPRFGASAMIGRGTDTNDITTLAPASGGLFLDESAERGNAYTYVVRVQNGKLAAFSDPASVEALPAKPVVTATSRVNGIELRWTVVGHTSGCEVTSLTPPGAPFRTVDRDVLMPCPGVVQCLYQVRCFNADGSPGESGLGFASLAPMPPPSCTATSMPGAVSVDWAPPSTGSVSYLVQRAVGAAAPADVASVLEGPYLDQSSPLFELAAYRVFSVGSQGQFDDTQWCSPASRAARTTVPAPVNLGPSTGKASQFDVPGQTFVAAAGGQLMAIELSSFDAGCLHVYTSGDPRTISTPCTRGVMVGNSFEFGPAAVGGAYYDLSKENIFVSSGETVAFELVGTDAVFSDDAVDGVATLYGGSRDAPHDLLFKAYVLPSSDLPAPALTATANGDAALLQWTASPGALGYDVIGAGGSVLLQTQDAHAIVSASASSSFQVRANGPGGGASSNVVSIAASNVVIDAANLCDDAAGTLARAFVGPGEHLEQTFTVVHSGVLASLEVAASPLIPFGPGTATDAVQAQLQDAASGTVLADFSILPAAPEPFLFPPLSPVLLAPTAVDLHAKGLQVTAGTVLRLVVGPLPAGGPTQLGFRISPDLYPGGGAILGSPSAIPTDLCFKTYVDVAP